MNILIVIPTLETGGAQKLLEDLIGQMRKDNNISVLVFQKSNSEIEKNIERLGVPIFWLNVGTHSPLAIFKMRKFLRNADIIHAHLFPAHYFTVMANIGINKPLIFTEHSTHNKRRDHLWLRPVEKFVYKRIDQTVSISEATQEALSNWLRLSNPENISNIILNGIPLDKFKNALKKSSKEMFGRSGIPVLMISRFTKAKDHKTVLNALKEIRNPDVFVVLVGDGELKGEIEQYANQLGLNDRVVFLGNRKDIPEIIKASAIGVQSSHWEGFGLTAVEMMAGGIPVVASDVKGLGGVVEGAGLLFEPGDHIALSKIIMQLISNPDLYAKTKEKCTLRAEMFSIESTANKYLELYSSTLT